ncbi:YgaB family protein [Aeribacillus pallidus]|jgi:hypothetical protein|uniref:YgaB family protein n=1 Tax=Aeribacillus pallidus TaxID=33936 RepID=UPI001D8D841D|nr:hypothetical protein [Bacillus sp. (in: firmicutes)]
MALFNELVQKQMKTMDKLLYLQAEIERCQKLKEELTALQDEAKVESIKQEIVKMKEELYQIQKQFEAQTDEVIQSYRDFNAIV